MTEQEAKIKDLELRIKKLEDKVFDQWLDQYQSQPKVNWTEEAREEWWRNTHDSDGNTYPNVTVDFEHNYHYNDMPPVGPFHGCSQEEIDENNRKWKEYLADHTE